MMAEIGLFFRFLLKAFPAFLLLTQVALPIYDRVSPWSDAVEALSRGDYRARVCIGLTRNTTIESDGNRSVSSTRTFLAMSGSPVPRLVVVSAQSPKASRLEDHGVVGTLLWAAMLGLCWFLLWRWWVRPFRAKGREGLRRAVSSGP